MADPVQPPLPYNHLPHALAYSVDGGAALIGLRSTKVWECIAADLITPIRVGRRTLVPYTELQRFLALPQAEIDAALAAYKQRKGSR